jgi:serine protease Do
VVDQAKPAVVNIFAVKAGQSLSNIELRDNQAPLPPEDFLEDFLGPGPEEPAPPKRAPETPPRPRRAPPKEKVQGSGFIIDQAGLVITNDHVVEGAETIKVKLIDGREIEAEIVGRDPKTDLALIKLKTPDQYPSLRLGDSDQVEIGDWLLAIGNPFGLEHTVTKGILSARGRTIGAGPYDDFLQTDASINPGNSGGPLLNLKAEVVGVNSMIYAGGNGIGFSIPSNLVSRIVTRLREKGYVERGFIGVVAQPLTDELSAAFGLKNQDGALVGDALENAPASRSGIRAGDVIVEFNGQPVRRVADLTALATEAPVGQEVKVGLIRDGQRLNLNLTVSRLDEPVPDNGSEFKGAALDLGLTLREINPETANRLGLEEREGLLVEQAQENSPAQVAGLQARDIILEVDHQRTRTLRDYNAALRTHPRGEPILMWVKRGDLSSYRAINLE